MVNLQGVATVAADGEAFFHGLRLLDRDADTVVARFAPAIGRMRLADVDGQEIDTVAVALVNLFQDPKLGSVGASGEAAEDQHHGLLAKGVAQAEQALAVGRWQAKADGTVAEGRSLQG